MADASGLNSIETSEHISPEATGDNIGAKRVANYVWDGTNWQRKAAGLVNVTPDDIELTNADGNGNYQTITYLAAATPVLTLSLTFDVNSNVTSIVKS